MSSPSSTEQKEEEKRKMELGQVTEKFRKSPGRNDGTTERGSPRAWMFQGKTSGVGVGRQRSISSFCLSSNVCLC